MVEVRTGELESLAHLAHEHGLHLPAPGGVHASSPRPRRPADRPAELASRGAAQDVGDELLEPLQQLGVHARPGRDRHRRGRPGRAQAGDQAPASVAISQPAARSHGLSPDSK